MQKTKLGIPIFLMGAFAWLLGYYVGYPAILLFVGYVLIAEENPWLRRQCCRVLAVMMCFTLLSTALNLLPNVESTLATVWSLFDKPLYWEWLHKIVNLISELIYWVKFVIFLGFALVSLKGKIIRLPLIDPFLEKHLS